MQGNSSMNVRKESNQPVYRLFRLHCIDKANQIHSEQRHLLSNVYEEITENPLEVADKTTLKGRFSPSFSLKTAFQPTGLHPFEQMATPFGADNYTLLSKGCSLPNKINPYAMTRFPPWELPFPLMGTTVSLNGNGNFS